MDAQITVFFRGLLSIAGTALLGMVTLYVKQHFTAKQVGNAKSAALIAVNAAEEIGRVTGIKGQDKLNAALDAVKLEAKKLGLKFSDEQWQGYLRDAVSGSRMFWDATQGSTDAVVSSTPVEPQNGGNAPVVVDSGVIAPPIVTSEPKSIVDVVASTLDQVGEQAKTQAVHDLTAKISAVVQEAVAPSVPPVV